MATRKATAKKVRCWGIRRKGRMRGVCLKLAVAMAWVNTFEGSVLVPGVFIADAPRRVVVAAAVVRCGKCRRVISRDPLQVKIEAMIGGGTARCARCTPARYQRFLPDAPRRKPRAVTKGAK